MVHAGGACAIRRALAFNTGEREMQTERDLRIRVHPSCVPFQFLRWMKGAWSKNNQKGLYIYIYIYRRRKKLFFNLFKMTIKLGICCLGLLLVTVYCSVLKYLYVILDGLFS